MMQEVIIEKQFNPNISINDVNARLKEALGPGGKYGENSNYWN